MDQQEKHTQPNSPDDQRRAASTPAPQLVESRERGPLPFPGKEAGYAPPSVTLRCLPACMGSFMRADAD